MSFMRARKPPLGSITPPPDKPSISILIFVDGQADLSQDFIDSAYGWKEVPVMV
jgi:hypothetical protein